MGMDGTHGSDLVPPSEVPPLPVTIPPQHGKGPVQRQVHGTCAVMGTYLGRLGTARLETFVTDDELVCEACWAVTVNGCEELVLFSFSHWYPILTPPLPCPSSITLLVGFCRHYITRPPWPGAGSN